MASLVLPQSILYSTCECNNCLQSGARCYCIVINLCMVVNINSGNLCIRCYCIVITLLLLLSLFNVVIALWNFLDVCATIGGMNERMDSNVKTKKGLPTKYWMEQEQLHSKTL